VKRVFSGAYTADWKAIATAVKAAAGWRCVRCGHPHDPKTGYTLTVDHLSGAKDDNAWFNLAALCQRCHLSVQGRVILTRPWVWEHTAWFRPYVAGHYARKYLGLHLSREEVEARMDELLALEPAAVLGVRA
jgi:5-methylcytosine-specific restriction endonuclease McrA